MRLGRILIVDDEPEIRALLRAVLSKAGYDVLEAADGEEAIKIFEADDNSRKVLTIICDLRMPKVDGGEAIMYFRYKHPSVPIVVLTATQSSKDIVPLLDLGVADYLSKPIEPEQLLTAVLKASQAHPFFKDPFQHDHFPSS